MVLSPVGGALKKMLTPFKFGLGGVIGSGPQFVSWIALEDLVGLIEFALHNEKLSGPVNATAPHPVRQAEFARVLGGILRRPAVLPAPAFGLKLLLGDMSVVGPRPHALRSKAGTELFEHAVNGYFRRHRVKPGITGWAQINGYRGPTADPELMRKRVEYDLDYIENWSLWLDIKILLATPFIGLVHRNAL